MPACQVAMFPGSSSFPMFPAVSGRVPVRVPSFLFRLVPAVLFWPRGASLAVRSLSEPFPFRSVPLSLLFVSVPAFLRSCSWSVSVSVPAFVSGDVRSYPCPRPRIRVDLRLGPMSPNLSADGAHLECDTPNNMMARLKPIGWTVSGGPYRVDRIGVARPSMQAIH